ncbi:hypothetical protein [Listeria marthii]|uniref:hypothetical protein n=1 Tax=Listeria marthii TaxID=529731 RepID=UPI0035E105D1
MGCNKSNADGLLKQVYEKLPGSKAALEKLDDYGQRYTVDMSITGPKGKNSAYRLNSETKFNYNLCKIIKRR